MPRLTNKTYLSIHYQLNQHNEQHHLRYLSPHDQLALHRYFLPNQLLSDDDLLAHRRSVTNEEPSLPSQAGRAWAHLQRILAEQERPYRPKPRRQSRAHGGRHKDLRIIVTSELRPEPDAALFARAIVKMAMDEVERDMKRHDNAA